MRISVINTCYNEESIMPFFLEYYTSFCNEIIFFDGNSTDNTHEIIKSYIGKTKCNIELRINHSIGTNDGYSENMLEELNYDRNLSLLYIRNNAWKSLFSKDLNDWILIVDADEFLYHPIGLRKKLELFRKDGITFPTIQGFNMISDDYPEFEKGRFLCEKIKSGYWFLYSSKNLIFDSKQITDINYQPGCHDCDPKGNVNKDQERFIDNIKLMHYKYICYEHFIKKEQSKFNHLSEINKKYWWGTHYKHNKDMMISEWERFKIDKNYFVDVTKASEIH